MPAWKWARACSAASSTVSGSPSTAARRWKCGDTYSLHGEAGNPLDREHITQPLVTGIRAIDGLLPCGKGQRMGIFGGSGVGKSTLLGSMSRAQFGRRHGDRHDRRAQSRGPRLPRKRAGAGRAQALGGGLRHFRTARAAARARLFRGAGGGRIFPRPGRRASCW